MSDGRILRYGGRRHECEPPAAGDRGDIWRCDCGRRYTCINHITERPGRITMRADWERRVWPWPR